MKKNGFFDTFSIKLNISPHFLRNELYWGTRISKIAVVISKEFGARTKSSRKLKKNGINLKYNDKFCKMYGWFF